MTFQNLTYPIGQWHPEASKGGGRVPVNNVGTAVGFSLVFGFGSKIHCLQNGQNIADSSVSV